MSKPTAWPPSSSQPCDQPKQPANNSIASGGPVIRPARRGWLESPNGTEVCRDSFDVPFIRDDDFLLPLREFPRIERALRVGKPCELRLQIHNTVVDAQALR